MYLPNVLMSSIPGPGGCGGDRERGARVSGGRLKARARPVSVRALRPQRTRTVSHVSKLTAAKQKRATGEETADDLERVVKVLSSEIMFFSIQIVDHFEIISLTH